MMSQLECNAVETFIKIINTYEDQVLFQVHWFSWHKGFLNVLETVKDELLFVDFTHQGKRDKSKGSYIVPLAFDREND